MAAITTFIARRYLRAGRDSRFFSWISLLTVVGVAIGCAAMIVVWSIINGFEQELRSRFLSTNAHIMAFSIPRGLHDFETWTTTIHKDFSGKISGISPFVQNETMARSETLVHAVLIRGVDPKLRRNVQDLSVSTQPPQALAYLQDEVAAASESRQAPLLPAAIVGKGLLSLMNWKVGDTIELINPASNDFGTMKKFRVVGTYESGLKHYDNRLILLSLPTAQKFFNMGQRFTGLEIGLHKPWNSKEIADDMVHKYAISVREWQSFNKPLFDAMEMERVVILAITALVAGVAGFNILTTIFVAVSQRQRDISILKALGANNRMILSLFIKQGAYIGVIGSVVGAGLAAVISVFLETYSSKILELPDLYMLSKLPMTYDWRVYAGVCATSIGIAVVAGFFPSLMASRIDPVQGFRGNEGAG